MGKDGVFAGMTPIGALENAFTFANSFPVDYATRDLPPGFSKFTKVSVRFVHEFNGFARQKNAAFVKRNNPHLEKRFNVDILFARIASQPMLYSSVPSAEVLGILKLDDTSFQPNFFFDFFEIHFLKQFASRSIRQRERSTEIAHTGGILEESRSTLQLELGPGPDKDCGFRIISNRCTTLQIQDCIAIKLDTRHLL